jgi:hypothetical protein
LSRRRGSHFETISSATNSLGIGWTDDICHGFTYGHYRAAQPRARRRPDAAQPGDFVSARSSFLLILEPPSGMPTGCFRPPWSNNAGTLWTLKLRAGAIASDYTFGDCAMASTGAIWYVFQDDKHAFVLFEIPRRGSRSQPFGLQCDQVTVPYHHRDLSVAFQADSTNAPLRWLLALSALQRVRFTSRERRSGGGATVYRRCPDMSLRSSLMSFGIES